MNTEEQIRGSEPGRYLAFSLGSEEYAFPLLGVKEVIAMPEVTPVPNMPAHFIGIMNLRGQVISILDLRQKFKMPKNTGATAEKAVVILDVDHGSVGIVVDSVNSVLAIAPDEISRKPELGAQGDASAILGIARKEKRLIVLLDIASIRGETHV